MTNTFLIKRRTSGAPGAPSALKGGELAYNEVDGYFYAGFGDDGSGNATSIKVFASDDFSKEYRVAPGGLSGQVLTKSTNADYDFTWATPTTGTTYTAGTGISITGSTITVDTSVVATVSYVGSAISTALSTLAISASQITSGTIDVARLPVIPGTNQVLSSGGISALTVTDQDSISQGTIVTTTDGRRWVYTGTGSKTAESSYIELADVTPEWSVIANKPSFATVATSGLYSDLTGTPTLGTMASQNANAVAITGGTINGITLDGGTF